MLAGSDGPSRIDFDNADLAQTIGVVALAFILAGLILAGPLGTRYGVVDVVDSMAGGNMACRGDEVRAGRGLGVVVPNAGQRDRRAWRHAG